MILINCRSTKRDSFCHVQNPYTKCVCCTGIELEQDGPHKGRLAMARRYDGIKSVANVFSRSYVLYSDDKGVTWTAGQLLPRERMLFPYLRVCVRMCSNA
eukprot:COSAG02_NODE_896_length_16125_cov_5.083489_12_plen_100_part_00